LNPIQVRFQTAPRPDDKKMTNTSNMRCQDMTWILVQNSGAVYT
jgi:hypothetical protein